MDLHRPNLSGGVRFGDIAGRVAQVFTLENESLRARVTDYGGILVSLETASPKRAFEHILLGFDNVGGYANNGGSFGALLGRNANRIAGGVFMVDGRTYSLSKNENGSTLHGGAVGFGKQFWSVAEADAAHIALRLTSPDGDQGFPGEVDVTATYRLDAAALHLSFEATTTKSTPLSLSAHPYFNLDGLGARDCLDHRIEILAKAFLPTDEKQIPTGERRPVADTAFDFTEPRRIGARIRDAEPQLRHGRGYDHYFMLPEDKVGKLQPAVRVYANASDHMLEVLTTQRGVQFYTGNNLNGSALGRGGYYRQSAGFAIEPQGFPNAVNQPDFPSTVLRPGERYREEIVYRFASIGTRTGT